MTDKPGTDRFRSLYQIFSSPLAEIDCGDKCGPHNDYGVPVCCDIQQVVPSAYQEEWAYLQRNTRLWRSWVCPDPGEIRELQNSLQEGQVLIQCQGYQKCQRDFRSLTCRAFPFYPYIDGQGDMIGLAYYRDFREKCWVISNLDIVSQEYKIEFRNAFLRIFEIFPEGRAGYQDLSAYFTEQANQAGEDLIVLDFNGSVLLVETGKRGQIKGSYADLAAFGPFEVTRELVFPDEKPDPKSGKLHG
jgi:hypothetical protein